MLSKQHERSFRTFLKAARMPAQPWISLVDATHRPTNTQCPVICILGEDSNETVIVPYALALSDVTRPILAQLAFPPAIDPLVFRSRPPSHGSHNQ